MYFVLWDHLGWWVAFYVARTCAFLVISLVAMIIVLAVAGSLGLAIPPNWLCNVLWGLSWLALEWKLGGRWSARERARLQRERI